MFVVPDRAEGLRGFIVGFGKFGRFGRVGSLPRSGEIVPDPVDHAHGLPRVDVKPSGQRRPGGAFGQQIFEKRLNARPGAPCGERQVGREREDFGMLRRLSTIRPDGRVAERQRVVLKNGEVRNGAAVEEDVERNGGIGGRAPDAAGAARLRDGGGARSVGGGHDACSKGEVHPSMMPPSARRRGGFRVLGSRARLQRILRFRLSGPRPLHRSCMSVETAPPEPRPALNVLRPPGPHRIDTYLCTWKETRQPSSIAASQQSLVARSPWLTGWT